MCAPRGDAKENQEGEREFFKVLSEPQGRR